MATSTPKGLLEALKLITTAPEASLRALGSARATQVQRMRELMRNRNLEVDPKVKTKIWCV
jgi:hypothetical protein